jgi:signal transduction histidine kinase
MTLHRWFILKFRNRVLAAGLLLLFTQLIFISAFMLNQEKQVRKDEAYVGDTVSIGISQKNHELIISTLASASDRWGVTRLELCLGDKQIFALPTFNSGCLDSSFKAGWFREEIKIVGFENARLRVFRSIFQSGQIIFILATSTFLIYIFFASQFQLVSKSLKADLLAPLANKLIEEKPLEILELEEIRRSIGNWKESIKNAARAEAFVVLASQVAHDIRAPLSAINAVLVRDGLMNEERFCIAQKAATRINDIANELLVSSKMRGAIGSFEPLVSSDVPTAMMSELSDLSDLVRDIFEEKMVSLGSDGRISLRLDISDDHVGRCNVVRSELLRVVSNLTNNAIESLDGSGVVTMAIRSDESNISIVILDNGKGIPEEIIGRLGVQRISFGKEDSQESGNGLGMFHAKEMVEGMAGKMLIQSQIGIGTMITLMFPRVQ